MSFVQGSRQILISTPLGADALNVLTLEGEEQISGIFHYRLELVSSNDSLAASSIVGKNATVTLAQPGGTPQYINGIVGRFVQGQKTALLTSYYIDLYPWLWLLTMSQNSQIFQSKSADQIITQVFSDLGFTAYKNSLTATYTVRDYCVQYRETAFQFVSRLMEEEGMYYYFTHTSSAHTLVLADDTTGFGTCPGLTTARLTKPGTTLQGYDVVTSCNLEQQVTVGGFKSDDYNFETPTTDLLVSVTGTEATRTVYDYPGKYTKKDAGESLGNIRMAAFEAPGTQISGASFCSAFQTGCKFTLADHYCSAANIAYVLTRIRHVADQHMYRNEFTAIPATVIPRPLRVTPRPRIAGVQPALVVGKAGEEIWTDNYGRIRVKFYWDQSAAADDTSTCWIRVAQGWAGKQWGAIFLPRIGQEVVVSFLEGDPDQPLVTGSVYNAQQTVPYTLPDNQTRSTIKSNSSKGGGGFNEIRFEDKAGSEEIFIQAQKDMNITVLNDETTTITNNRTCTISTKDEKLIVSKGNRTVQVSTGNETHEVQGTRAVTVTGNETHTDKADFTHNVTGNFTLKVSGNLDIEVTGSVKIKSGTTLDTEAGTALTDKAGTALTNQAGTSLTNKSGTALTNQAGTSMSNQASISITSTANASHTVSSSGTLTIKGAMVAIN